MVAIVCSLDGQIFLNVTQLEVVLEVAHCFLEGVDAVVAHFGLITRLDLWLRSFSGRFTFTLFDLFCVVWSFSTLRGLLDVQLRVPVDV